MESERTSARQPSSEQHPDTHAKPGPADTTKRAEAAQMIVRNALEFMRDCGARAGEYEIALSALAALAALVAELDRLRGERDAERNARKVAERNEGTALTDGDAAAARAFNAEAELAAARAELERERERRRAMSDAFDNAAEQGASAAGELERVTRERDENLANVRRIDDLRMKEIGEKTAELVAVRERAERMRDALAFYADRERYWGTCDAEYVLAIEDEGAIARAVLEEGQQIERPTPKPCDLECNENGRCSGACDAD